MPKGRLPHCPDWLEDDAKKEWKRLGKVLAEMGMLTNLDMMAFAGYCQAYARWKGAEEFITQHGDMVRTPNGYLQQVPQVAIAQTNLKIMLKFCEQFGLTPSARSRIIAMSSTSAAICGVIPRRATSASNCARTPLSSVGRISGCWASRSTSLAPG